MEYDFRFLEEECVLWNRDKDLSSFVERCIETFFLKIFFFFVVI